MEPSAETVATTLLPSRAKLMVVASEHGWTGQHCLSPCSAGGLFLPWGHVVWAFQLTQLDSDSTLSLLG